VALWNTRLVNFKAYRCFASILFTGRLRGLVVQIRILNLYASYRDQNHFWDRSMDADILKMDSLIVDGNLNATIGQEECWGSKCRMDPLADKLKTILCDRNLMDTRPQKLAPT